MAFSRKSDLKFSAIIPPPPLPEQQVTPPPNGSANPIEGESVIGPDLSIEGQSITMRCKGCLRINGSIQAELHCVELLVGQQAVIAGSITATKVAVSGRVDGTIIGDSVVLHSTAHVEGDIHSRFLSIEQGASFDGRSRKITESGEKASELSSLSRPDAKKL